MSKENLLSTRQFATLCQTTKHTLIHYDEIGILKPTYVGENGYRYYSLSQTEIFDVISFLKEMGLPLKEIKAYLENRDIDKLLELFQMWESELELERKQLEKRKKMLQNMMAPIFWAQQEPCEEVIFEKKAEEYLVVIELPKDGDSLESRNRKYEQLSYCRQHDFFEGQVTGHIIEKKDLERDHYHIPGFFFSILSQKKHCGYLKTKPAGRYASLVHKGSRDTIDHSYRKLKRAIAQAGYDIAGGAYEYEWINYMQSGDEENYRTLISIQIQKNQK